MVIAAARNAVLRHLRVQVQAPIRPFNLLLSRGCYFSSSSSSDKIKGSFLDKSEASNRITFDPKNIKKVDPSTVTLNAHFHNDLKLVSLDTVEEFGFEILVVDFIASHPQAK